jgi:Mor transcription activator family.
MESCSFKSDMEILRDLVGPEAYAAIVKEFGGQAIYIARRPPRDDIYDKICAEHRSGARYRDLARKYSFSEAYIRRLCRNWRPRVAA